MAIVQFELTGDEEQIGYLVIKNQKCKYIKGIHLNPTVSIKADSKLWLDITNKDIDNIEAFLNKEY